ncbi:MAG: transketolase [Candidatus Hydromicrobium americanum]|nr:MAG: transketolase [Candidatus Hydromicrobium americanum]
MDKNKLEKISKLIRYFILISTTRAGSGHPSSSLSAVELMSTLFFGGFFKFKINDIKYINNDRLIFSKGHASPLMYSLWAAAGAVSEEELLTLRKFESRLEGHPTPDFPYAEAATGSLGQGLSIGLGMALNAKYVDKLPYYTYVLLGDSEMTEGSQWEAIQIAVHYKLDNLIGIIDVNRLGQRGETIYGWDIKAYEKRISSFGWETITVDGHNIKEIADAYEYALSINGRPTMIIAKTIKGKGVSLLEDKDGWHGKAISEDQMDTALKELGDIDKNIRGKILDPEQVNIPEEGIEEYDKIPMESGKIATRKAYGNALVNIFSKYPQIVVLDAEVGNSTYSEIFKKRFPQRFFEMYIAEQNMTGTALGLSLRGKIPFISSFAAFLTRAFDQIRMSQYSKSNIKFVGSHSGVSIGEDGASQMGLEDIAMFRTLLECVVLYPSDGISTEKLVEKAAKHFGNVYIRTTRMDTPIIYNNEDDFKIGGSKVVKESDNDVVTICAAGVTLHEALKAYEKLKKENILVRVIDVYSIKPIDKDSIRKAQKETKAILTVEDHYAGGGIGETVKSVASEKSPVYILAVRKMPRSGKPYELLNYEEISYEAIIKKVKEIIK